MRFSDTEIKDFILAWVLISVAFAIALGQTESFFTNLWLAALTVGVAFIVHELAHKFFAQHYGKFAEFKASVPMLLLAVALSFTGVLFAAPGAVVVSGFVSRKESGIIALAGPLSNIALALLILPLLFILQGASSLILYILVFGFMINAWLALFNLIPFWVFDGAKIIAYNKLWYGVLVATSLVMVVASGPLMRAVF